MRTYSVNEAADLLGLRPGKVRQAIRDGELDAEADGRDYWIERKDLEDYADEHGLELAEHGRDDDDLDERVDAALEEHRPSWEAGFRSGFAAGAHEDLDE